MNIKNELIAKYGAETIVCEIADSEFTAGTVLSEAFKAAGYTQSARSEINDSNWWNLTVAQLAAEIAR